MGWLWHLLLLGVAVYVVAQIVPGIKLKGFGTAIVVALVYSVANFLFDLLFGFITFIPQVLTLGLLTLLINAGLLWLTDKLIEDFEIKDFTTTFIAALLITVFNGILSFVF